MDSPGTLLLLRYSLKFVVLEFTKFVVLEIVNYFI